MVAEIARLQAENDLLAAEAEARQTRDPDKALEVIDARHRLTEAQAAVTQAQQIEASQGAAVESWNAALQTFSVLDADPVLRPIIAPLSQKKYSEDPAESARAFGIDIGLQIAKTFPQIVKEIEARAEARLRPTLEKEARARTLVAEPPVDTGSGGASEADDENAFLKRFNANPNPSQADFKRARLITSAA